MATTGFRLGVDLGTSHTAAALSGPDGRIRTLIFDGSPLLPSAVFAGPDVLLVGADAVRAAVGYPAGLEPHPKRRIDDGTVWLGEREYPVVELLGAVLARVAAEASRTAGGDPVAEVVLAHPAAWGRPRLGLLTEAATRAGWHEVRLVAEPVAAAAYFASVLGRRIPAGRCIVVYDLGAGTFDVSLVRPRSDGFDVVATAGLPDIGGLDLDAEVVRHVHALTAGAGEAWQRLNWPQNPADQHARHTLWQAARAVKEQLSRHPWAELYVPIVDQPVHLTREEFEKAASPHLERTVTLTLRVLAEAGIAPGDVGGVFLVGGSSRTPLATTLLHRTLRIAPTVTDQPELVVAEGVLRTDPVTTGPVTIDPVAERADHALPTRSTPVTVTGPVDDARSSAPGAGTAVTPAEPPRPAASRPTWGMVSPNRRRTRIAAAAVAACIVLASAVTLAVAPLRQILLGGQNGPMNAPAEPVGDPLGGHTSDVYSMVFSPDGDTLATGSSDRTVRLWDTASRQPVGVLLTGSTGSTGTVYSLAFSPDGETLATGSWGSEVLLWDATSHQVAGQLSVRGEHAYRSEYAYRSVHGLAFTPDGRTLATGGSDRTVSLWDVASRRLLDEMEIDSAANALAISPDGDTLAVSYGRLTSLWDVATRQPIGEPLTGHTDDVRSVAFSPDGRTLATTGGRTIQLWQLTG